jgi:hypothetical protein
MVMQKIKALTKITFGFAAAVCVGLFGYVLGSATRPLPPASRTPGTKPAFSAMWKDWTYPGARFEDTMSTGSGSSSSTELKELFPGARFVGRSETITRQDNSGDLYIEFQSSADPIEKVFDYYRIHAAGITHINIATAPSPAFGTFTTSGSGGGPDGSYMYELKNAIDRQTGDKRSTQIYARDGDAVTILLSQRKADATTSIVIITHRGPTTTTTTVRNPPQLPFLSH